MALLLILLALIIVGFLLWVVNRFIAVAGSIKSILNGVVVIGVVFVTPECIRNLPFSFGNSSGVTSIRARFHT